MTDVKLTLHAFPDSLAAGAQLADALNIPCRLIAVHRFPDLETLVTAAGAGEQAIVYRPLHEPNAKLIELLLAASALRDQGAREIVLVAPYLPYMRQDTAFAPGQAVSQREIGRLLASSFDAFVAVAPHLHRTHALTDVFGGKPAIVADVAPVFADLLRHDGDRPPPVLLGPDAESATLISRVAALTGMPWAVATKHRSGDRTVEVSLPGGLDLRGRCVVIIDDVVASGGTLLDAARAARAHGAARVEAVVCHALPGVLLGDLAAGHIARLRSADGVPHPSNAVSLTPLLADAVRSLLA